jgi:hypothetical protein
MIILYALLGIAGYVGFIILAEKSLMWLGEKVVEAMILSGHEEELRQLVSGLSISI